MRFIRREAEPLPVYWRAETEEWAVHPPDYKEAFKDDLKEEIPLEARRWDPVNQMWIVRDDYKDTLGELLEEYFPQYEVVWMDDESDEEGFELDYDL